MKPRRDFTVNLKRLFCKLLRQLICNRATSPPSAEERLHCQPRDSPSVNKGMAHLQPDVYCNAKFFLPFSSKGQLANWSFGGFRSHGQPMDRFSVNNGKVYLHLRKSSRCLLYYSSLYLHFDKRPRSSGSRGATAKAPPLVFWRG